jgi:hypothetical protein
MVLLLRDRLRIATHARVRVSRSVSSREPEIVHSSDLAIPSAVGMRPALDDGVDRLFSLYELAGALDLWGCMWSDAERQCYETAVVRTLIDDHTRHVRSLAFVLCHVIGTPRLDAAAAGIESRLGAPDEAREIELRARPLRRLCARAVELRGLVGDVEALVRRAVGDPRDVFTDRLLDFVDPRDLLAVARTTVDARLFGEVERRLARRGRYQRERLHSRFGYVAGEQLPYGIGAM